MLGLTSIIFPQLIELAEETGCYNAGIWQNAPRENNLIMTPLSPGWDALKDNDEPLVSSVSGATGLLFSAFQLTYLKKNLKMPSNFSPELMESTYDRCRNHLFSTVNEEGLLSPQRTLDEYQMGLKRFKRPLTIIMASF